LDLKKKLCCPGFFFLVVLAPITIVYPRDRQKCA
jgi:hypothetical protein